MIFFNLREPKEKIKGQSVMISVITVMCRDHDAHRMPPMAIGGHEKPRIVFTVSARN